MWLHHQDAVYEITDPGADFSGMKLRFGKETCVSKLMPLTKLCTKP